MFNQEFVFAHLKKVLLTGLPEYYLGVNASNTHQAYCLVRKIGDEREIIIIKDQTTETTKDFNQEIENLAKYFNATLIIETI